MALLALLAALAGGCRSIGPGTIKRDRLHYSSAVAESFKEQLLLNIVKTRYGDAPAFLEVSSLVSGYSLETGVSVNGEFSPENLRGDTFVGGELSGKYTDRPTISYTPMTGERFARSLLSPVSVDALMFVIQGGAPADYILGLTVQSLEGHHNEGIYGGQFEPGDAAFGRLLQLMRALQQARMIEPEVVKQQDRTEVWLHFRAPAADRTNLVHSLAELKGLLGVAPEKDRARVVFGMSSPEPGVIAIRSRSLMQILSTLGAGVEVPAEHLSSGGAVPAGAGGNARRLIVRSGLKKPAAAFVSVPYEGRWFWVEQNDLASKTTLSFVTVLFSFLDASGKQSSPVLTIPTN